MRIGVFGGTFDPPHVGHLLAAGDAADALQLDRVLFIPAAAQPLKAGAIVATSTDRLAMVRKLVGDDPRFGVESIEIDRGGLSYTVDTLRALRERWRGDLDLALFLLLGADAMATLPKWRETDALRTLAQLVELSRAGEHAPESAAPAGVRRIVTRRVDMSSTEIRARVRAGRSIRGFVPDAVAEFIAVQRLYQ